MGAGAVADAFFTAFKIPNMLRDLVAEGSLSPIVVSRLAKTEAQEGRARTLQLIRRLFAFWGLALLLIALLGILLAPILVSLIGRGFQDEAQVALAVRLTRIIFPYIILVSLAALTMGVLHHYKSFGWASIGSSCSNITVILISLGLVAWWGRDELTAVYAITFAMLCGGLMQWVSAWPGVFKKKVSILPEFCFDDPEVKKVLMLIGPSVIGVSAIQINVAVNHAYASHIETGAVTALYYSFRVMQLPVGIVGVAVSTVLLPTLSGYFQDSDDHRFIGAIKKALVDVSFLAIPAIAGLLVLGEPLVGMLYERGKFTSADTVLTARALLGFSLGILAYVYNKNLIQAYFSRNDIRFTVLVSIFSMGINAGINYTLTFVLSWGILGLTTGTSLVLWINCMILALGLHFRHKLWVVDFKMLRALVLMIFCSAIMAFVLLKLKEGFEPKGQTVMVLSLTATGLVVYFGGCFLLKRVLRRDVREI